jgi:PAS domain S-box-containing protein
MITNAITVKTLSILMVLIGAMFLFLSLPPAVKIRGSVEGRLRGKWLVIVSLIVFFLLGYLFFDLVLIFNLTFPVELVTGAVFLCGAVFVFMVINISRSTVTARQKAEEALRESETCFHVIFDSIHDAIIIQNTESGVILGVNDRMCRMFSYTHEEALKLSIGELMAENPHKDFCAWLDSANPRGMRSFECMVKNREGTSFWVEVNIQSAIIGGCNRRLLTMRDIDKRKHSEERLAKLNECFLGFVTDHGENIRRLTTLCGEMMGAACALYNKLETGKLQTLAHWNAPPDFKMTDEADGHLCNDVVRRGGDRLFCQRNLPESPYAVSDPNVMRYNLQTYIGMPVKCSDVYVGSLCVVFQMDFVPDEEDERFMGILAVAVGVEEERRIAAEKLLKAHAELESRVLERTAELARANEQLQTDIAERKKAEEALWKSESVLRKIFDSIPDLLSVIDRDLRIVRSNWHGGYEYVPEDLRDKSPYCHEAYYPGQDRPCENCHTLEVFRTGKPAAMEKYNSRIGMIEAHAYPVFDESGNVVMVVEHVRDVTESRRLEEELRKVQKLESLGVLAGGIAHDFNNLLTGIMGNISLAKVLINPQDKAFRRLDEAEKAVWRARDLTQQLLTFSKGGAPVRKTSSIEQIVMDSASFVLRGSNVRCEFMVPHNVWPVEADEGQMNQVINNLIINSDQAMPDGGVIKVRIENLLDGQGDPLPMKEGRYVRVSIEDHGVGIPEEYLQKIFDPYFTTKQKGSGLGLATAYSIIKSHDGYISVESKVGAGTTFHVYIPASEKGPQATGVTKDASIKGSGRILVMDDEEIIREVAEEILGHLGYRVVVCCDGAEALEEYRKAAESGDPFAAVIMDLTVPGGMGGKETMKRLQELDSKVIGIVSSGYSNDPILAHYREYGFSGVAAKPYNMEDLGRELHDLLANGGLPPQYA